MGFYAQKKARSMAGYFVAEITLDLRLVRLGLSCCCAGNAPHADGESSDHGKVRHNTGTQTQNQAQAADHRCKCGSFPTPFKMPITLSLGSIQISEWPGDKVTLQAWPVKGFFASAILADLVAFVAYQ